MSNQADEEEVWVPVVEERVSVGKRIVETDHLTLRKRVEEVVQEVREPLLKRTFEVERISVNRVVDEAPAPRMEGDTTVYSVVEERLVLVKQTVVVEEIRVRLREQMVEERQTVRLRREHLEVERESGPAAGLTGLPRHEQPVLGDAVATDQTKDATR